MMKKGVAIQYGDVAPEAKENFVPESNDSQFNTLDDLQKYNLDFPNYGNPCELYSVKLDGSAVAFPSVPENANLGLWSSQLTQDDGTFENPVVLELESAGQYSSQGLTLTFDTYNDIFATRVRIKWLRVTNNGITTIVEREFEPTSAFYFCREFVENYNKVVLTFYSLNMPKNRLKLRVIDYGYGTIFYGNELRNAKIIQELNPISTEISINTADFTLDSKTDMEYSFQAKQPLSVYFNGELKATTFVKSSKRKAKKLWEVQSEDYVGLMDGIQYRGGIYTNAKAVDILADIFATAKIPYKVDSAFSSATVTGFIPYGSCREALMQVAFAIQAVVDTSNSEVVEIMKLDDDVKQTIPLNRIKQGQNFVNEETITGVEVVAHSYKPISETVDAYDATQSATGQNIFVLFSEPLHDLSISNGSIVESGTNYAIINANAGCLLKGQKYEHIKQVYRRNNPLVLASEIEKIASIEKATLVSVHNIDNILEKCYNWLIKTNSVNLDIVEGKHIKYDNAGNVVTYDQPVNVGEVIKAETEYLGTVDGRIVKQSFSLNGNILIKKAVLK